MTNSDNPLMELATLRDFIRYGISRFQQSDIYYGHGTDNALDEATALVLHALALPHDLPGHFMESALLVSEKRRILGLFEQRIESRLPVPYLTHEAWFGGMPFYVDERVLVPRSPIAELISAHFEPWIQPERVEGILDLCTGSGCIAIACAHAFPEARVTGADVSAEALEVAQINRERHRLETQLELVQSDLFGNLGGHRYDIIVTNPPYVDADEIAAMPEEYRHEPMLGLAAGADGLDLIVPILAQAPAYLNEGGILVAEVGASDAALAGLFPEVPFTWLDFEHGGGGVFLLDRAQLDHYHQLFAAEDARRGGHSV